MMVDTGDDHESNDHVILNAPSLYMRPSYFRQTRKRGKIFKTVTERYIRDDLGLGSYYVDTGENRAKRRVNEAIVGKPRVIEDTSQLLSLLHDSAPLVICDTNVLLHNIDVLEQSAEVMPNLVIPQTALTECRSNQLTAYDRTVELLRAVGDKRLVIFFADPHHGETAHADESASINDINDERIRSVAEFYASQLQGTNVRVILLTDDAGSRAKAKEEGALYDARTVRSYVKELERNHPDLSLSDLVAQYGSAAPTESDFTKEHHFPPHADALNLSRGVQSGQYHRGVLRSTGADTALATIRRGEDRVAVTIQGWKDRNRAIDGDVVAISLHPVSQWISSFVEKEAVTTKDTAVGIASDTAEPTNGELDNVPDALSLDDVASSMRPTGTVAGIIRRNFSNYCGSIYSQSSTAKLSSERDDIASKHEMEHADGSTTCVFFPVDTKIPPILIRTTQRERLVGQRILVSMDSWPSHSPFPLGHYVRTIGQAGSKDVETHVLLQQYMIPHEPFPAKVLACLPPADFKIDIDNSPGRTDLRRLPVLSIDPPGCKDIDDALHCIVLPNGNYQVGVHIADVTHYVMAGTAIDLEAANRSTSTYLVNKRLDMLPGLLTTDLCSLKGNVDR
jgi:exosome complex exonuclease DIS3/RRP44